MAVVDVQAAAVRAVQNAARAAYPELVGADLGGIWEELEAKRTAYGDMKLPRGQFRLMPARPWMNSPMTVVVYEQPVEFFYLALTPGGASEEFRTLMSRLQRQIERHGLKDDEADDPEATGTEFTVLHEGFGISVYDGDQIQEMLLLRNNYAQAGMLEFSFLTGDDGR